MLLAAAFLLLPPWNGEEVVLHVALNGDDAWSGRLEAANDDRSDGPVATVGRARDLVRPLKHRAAVRIVVHGGFYPLEEPLVLAPEDSGDADHPVTYAAASGEHPVLSAGRALPRWRSARLGGRAIWSADASGFARIRDLYVGDRRRTPARRPDQGFLHVEGVPDLPPGTPWTDGKDALRFPEADAASWKDAPGADLVTFTRWIDTHLTVAAVDLQKRVAKLTRRTVFLLDPGDLCFLEGRAEYLDAPGEWFLDEHAGAVDYLPYPGESPGDSPAVAPVLDRILELRGEPEHDRWVEHVRFEGLTFSHSAWWFPEAGAKGSEPMGFVQAAWGVPGAVRAEGARHVVFEGCTVSHVGAYGLELGRGCTDDVVSRCTFTDLGAGGVKIGEAAIRESEADRTARNVVEDCTIRDGGRVHHQAVGLWIGQSGDNVIAHDRITELDYTGISIGWTWGYGPSLAGGNRVEWNEVDHLGDRPGNTEPPLGDMGGIYTLGIQPGTVIRDNYFHDIAGRTIAWGIYFDEGSSGIVAEENLVLRTSHGGFHQHYGRENVVRNNVFAFGRDGQVWRSRREDHLSFTFERNVVVADGAQWFRGDWSGGVALRGNVYWRTDGDPVTFPGPKVLDAGSVAADPGIDLTDPERFTVREDSPARALGFHSFDLSSVGPR